MKIKIWSTNTKINKVDVPVDDVLCVTKCSNKTIAANATINLFMESNKLKLSA